MSTFLFDGIFLCIYIMIMCVISSFLDLGLSIIDVVVFGFLVNLSYRICCIYEILKYKQHS